MTFNINDKVKVRLTEHGHEILKRQYDGVIEFAVGTDTGPTFSTDPDMAKLNPVPWWRVRTRKGDSPWLKVTSPGRAISRAKSAVSAEDYQRAENGW